MYFTTRKFWTDFGERVVSTAAQAGLGFVGAAAFVPDIASVKAAGIVMGVAAAIAGLKCFAVGRGTETPGA